MLNRNSALDLVLRSRAGEEFHGLDGVHVVEDAAEDPDAAEFVGVHQDLLAAGPRAVHVDGGPDPLIDQAPVEVQLHVARAL